MRIVDRQATIQNTALLIWVFVLTLPLAISNFAIALLLVVSIAGVVKKREIPKTKTHWFLPLLFLYYVLSELIYGGEWPSVEKRLLFILVPLVFVLNPDFTKDQLRIKIWWSYIAGNLFAIVICVGRALFRSLTWQEASWQFNPNVVKETTYDFLTSSVMGGNYFLGKELSAFHDPTYFGIFIVFAQFLVFEIYKSTKRKLAKSILIGSYLVFWIALFLLSSKAAIISSLLLTSYIVFYILLKTRIAYSLKFVTVCSVITISLLFIFFNPRLNTFKKTFWVGLAINPNARFGHDLRILSWDASLDIIKAHWLFGVGEPNKEAALLHVYQTKNYLVPAQEKFNSHNQYLGLLIGGGVLALGIFLWGIISLLADSIKNKNQVLFVFLLLFTFNALFENLIDRHAGILFFSAFASILPTHSSID